MSAKSNTEVLIGGKVYTLSGYEGEEYLQRVAAYINNKINEFNEMENVRRLPADMKTTLIELNIADDFFKAKDRIEKMERDLDLKEKELYDLKHELASVLMQVETKEKSGRELELQNKELLLQKAKLESALEDALLGSVQKEEPSAPAQEGIADAAQDDFADLTQDLDFLTGEPMQEVLDLVLDEPKPEQKPSGTKNKKRKK